VRGGGNDGRQETGDRRPRTDDRRPKLQSPVSGPQSAVPDIPLARCMGVLRSYRANGQDGLFEDHLLWMLQNFRWNDDGGFLITQDAA